MSKKKRTNILWQRIHFVKDLVEGQNPSIMLFFGAGASRDAGVSTVTELVEDFINILKKQPDPLLLKCVEESHGKRIQATIPM